MPLQLEATNSPNRGLFVIVFSGVICQNRKDNLILPRLQSSRYDVRYLTLAKNVKVSEESAASILTTVQQSRFT